MENIAGTTTDRTSLTAYKEVKIGRTIYRVTSVYLGEIDLKNALEDLTIRKVMEEIDCADNSAFATI